MKNHHLFSVLKKIIILIFLLFIFTSICAISYVSTVSAHIQDSVFRLHIIANSNTSYDQDLKYMVRDKIIEYMKSISANCSSKEEIIALANQHLSDFEQIAKDVVKENGYNYEVSVSIGNFEFPTKQYGDVSLPAGFYDALEINIGEASGQNWWCVMFPPLCFVDVTTGIVPDDSKELLQNELSEEEFYIVSGKSSDIKLKFKLLELFSNVASIYTSKR
ncbi:MAG: stage II sporulation protein R [Clostridia bacterium]|nr:stage II sporulation protein R [Clostridia bacterium]